MKPFVANDNNLLWIALTGRNSGVRCSKLIDITLTRRMALDFDLACADRLLQFENEREFARLKMFKAAIKGAVAELFAGTASDDETEAETPEPNENDIL